MMDIVEFMLLAYGISIFIIAISVCVLVFKLTFGGC